MTDSLNIAKSLVNVSGKSKKCIFSCFLGDKEVKDAINYFDNNNFANFETPSDALIGMNYLLDYSLFNYHQTYRRYIIDEEKVKHIKSKLKNEDGLLSYSLTKEIMDILAIKIPQKQIIKTCEEAENIILEEGKKYVLKGDGKGLVHKKELGGVVLGVDKYNFKKIISEMFFNLSKESDDVSITLEEEVSGVEVIVGLKSNGLLGNFIMFGMGGTYVNVVGDVNFSTCPLSEERAMNMIKNSKIYKLLKGYRDIKPTNIEHLKEIIIRISHLQEIFPEIKEVDLNPVICSDRGIYLVDVKIIV
jgi:acetyltransferase